VDGTDPRGFVQDFLDVFGVPLLIGLGFPDVVRIGNRDENNDGED